MDTIDIPILLFLYKQHPCLYAVKSRDYHNRLKRDAAFTKICANYEGMTDMSLSVEIFKKNAQSQIAVSGS